MFESDDSNMISSETFLEMGKMGYTCDNVCKMGKAEAERILNEKHKKEQEESARKIGKAAALFGSLFVTNAVVDKLNKDSSDALRKGREYAEKAQREVEQAARDFYNS